MNRFLDNASVANVTTTPSNEKPAPPVLISEGPIFMAVDEKLMEVYIWPLAFTFVYTLLGSLGNAFVLYIYGFKWERNKTRIFILCLAMLDMFNCCFNMPMEIAMLWHPIQFDYNALCKFSRGITYVINNTGSLVFVAVAVDRFLSVYKPLKRRILTTTYAKVMCVVCFFVASSASWPAFIFYGSKTVYIPVAQSVFVVGTTCYISDNHDNNKHLIFIFTTCLFILLLIVFVTLTVLYIAIGRKIYLVTGKKQQLEISKKDKTTKFLSASVASTILGKSPIKSPSSDSKAIATPPRPPSCVSFDESMSCDDSRTTTVGKKCKRNGSNITYRPYMSRRHSSVNSSASRNNTLMMRMVTIAFMIAFTPFLAIVMIRNLRPELYFTLNKSGKIAYQVLLRSYMINSVVNPYIYGFMNIRFRNEVRKLLERIFCRKSCCRTVNG